MALRRETFLPPRDFVTVFFIGDAPVSANGKISCIPRQNQSPTIVSEPTRISRNSLAALSNLARLKITQLWAFLFVYCWVASCPKKSHTSSDGSEKKRNEGKRMKNLFSPRKPQPSQWRAIVISPDHTFIINNFTSLSSSHCVSPSCSPRLFGISSLCVPFAAKSSENISVRASTSVRLAGLLLFHFFLRWLMTLFPRAPRAYGCLKLPTGSVVFFRFFFYNSSGCGVAFCFVFFVSSFVFSAAFFFVCERKLRDARARLTMLLR